jgi:hypothetical protein
MSSSDRPVQRTNPARRREFNRAGEEVDYFVRVVCTDRGQHGRVLLTTARRELNGEQGMSFALQYFAPPMRDAESESLTGRESYVFRCPRCTRTPQIKADRWWAAVEAVVLADLDELDISLLPF